MYDNQFMTLSRLIQTFKRVSERKQDGEFNFFQTILRLKKERFALLN